MKSHRLKSLVEGGISAGRLFAAVSRRFDSVSHNMSYARESGVGSENFARIKSLREIHRGERCFILGNGPSLARMDLSQLANEYSFGTNRIFLIFSRTNFKPSYYVCINDLMIRQSRQEIADLEMPLYLNWRERAHFARTKGVTLLRESYRAHFATDPTQGVWGGGTVTFVALQLAYYMGFQQVITIGLDHQYAAKGRPHQVTKSDGLARDHFHPSYFPKGFRWQLPDLATSEFAYGLAKEAYEADGREILDATLGGKLQVFRKVDFDSVVS